MEVSDEIVKVCTGCGSYGIKPKNNKITIYKDMLFTTQNIMERVKQVRGSPSSWVLNLLGIFCKFCGLKGVLEKQRLFGQQGLTEEKVKGVVNQTFAGACGRVLVL